MDTEKVADFKGIYLEETRQYYLCDFRRNLSTQTYRINIDLHKKIRQDVIFSKDSLTSHWQAGSNASIFPTALIEEIIKHISKLEQDMLIVTDPVAE